MFHGAGLPQGRCMLEGVCITGRSMPAGWFMLGPAWMVATGGTVMRS
ncbi:MAG: hypothetical protein R3C70_00450 [Geminicoccaceae bacterium]